MSAGSDVRVCRRDGEPLVFTFEFPGAEYVCVVCGATEDVFGSRSPLTVERQRRLSELTEQYGRERAERTGRPYVALQKVGDAGVEVPTCGGCGLPAADGLVLDGTGKPPGWFGRTRDGRREYACSRSCIPSSEAVLPW